MTERLDDRHLTAEELTAYLESEVSMEDRARIERHLDGCEACFADAAGSFRIVREARPGGSRLGPWGLVLAAAAVLVVVSVGTMSQPGGPDAVFRAGEAPTPVEAMAPIRVVEPEDGQSVGRADLRFVWGANEAGAFYRFTLTDEAGSVVTRVSTRETTVILEPEVDLDAGRDYYWIVDALLDGGRTGTTGAQRFRVARP